MNTDTPETNYQARENKYSEGCWGEESCVPADFAAKLERERDEAREQRDNAREQRDRLEESILNLSHPNCKMLIRERDEAREQIQYNCKATLIIERMLYESREQRDRLAAVLQSIRDGYGGQVAAPDCCEDCEFLIRIDKVLQSLTPKYL